MKISVLDHSGVSAGHTPDEAIRDTLALAALCDTLGYHRYWVSEHHGSASIAGTAPEVLMAAIAGTTKNMRIGSGGVMLPHYAALKVAEQFRVLEAIAPGRIDLGIGRAPGTDGHTAQALNPHAFSNGEDRFPGQLRDLLAWVRGAALPAGHPFAQISAQPEGGSAPDVWMLGSSDYGAQIAGYFGLPYCFAHFFRPGAQGDASARAALQLYRDTFRPSATLAAPYAALCVGAFAADTSERAEFESGPGLLMRLWREKGAFAPMPSPQSAADYPYSARERAWLEGARQAQIYGTGAQARAGLEALAARTGAPDEIFIVSMAHDPAVRRHSFTLIAEAFGLSLTAGASRAA